MQEKWHDISAAFDVYQVQVTRDGSIRYRPKFYIVGQDPSERSWRLGKPPKIRVPATPVTLAQQR